MHLSDRIVLQETDQIYVLMDSSSGEEVALSQPETARLFIALTYFAHTDPVLRDELRTHLQALTGQPRETAAEVLLDACDELMKDRSRVVR